MSGTLDGSGTVTFQQLYTPYGTSRYSNGSSPTTLGYTGQRADASTGLDYYQARYYDPAAGQFTSADTVNDGLNRYGYVHGNPTTATDPSGHKMCMDDDVSSCIPYMPGSSHAPTIVNVITNQAPPTYHRNDDDTVTITALTITDYVWSDGHVTKQYSSSSKTICDQKCHHLQHSHELDREAGKFAVGGYVLLALAALVDLFTGGIKQTLTGFLLLIDLLGNALSYVAQAFGASGDFYQLMYRIAGIMNTIGGLIESALALISIWGDLALGAASSIVYAIRAAAAGVPGMLILVVFKTVGQILGAGLLAASYLAFSQYDLLERQAKQEQSIAASLKDGDL